MDRLYCVVAGREEGPLAPTITGAHFSDDPRLLQGVLVLNEGEWLDEVGEVEEVKEVEEVEEVDKVQDVEDVEGGWVASGWNELLLLLMPIGRWIIIIIKRFNPNMIDHHQIPDVQKPQILASHACAFQ